MMVGVVPYYSRDDEVFIQNILKGPLLVPGDMSNDAKQLIRKLLNRNPVKRLGAGPSDAEEIKKMPFFKGVDWDFVYQRKQPVPVPPKKPVPELDIDKIQYAIIRDYNEAVECRMDADQKLRQIRHLKRKKQTKNIKQQIEDIEKSIKKVHKEGGGLGLMKHWTYVKQ